MPPKIPNLTIDRLRSLDPRDMLGMTLELPDQIERGLDMGRRFAERISSPHVRQLDWIGLGGSAVAGDILRGMGYEPPNLSLTISVQRYPRESTARRLFCSYSGNTVETTQAFAATPHRRVYFALSSGGRLQELAADARVPHLRIPDGYPPRAAVGFTLGAMLGIFEQVYAFRTAEILAACKPLAADADRYRRLNPDENPALALAARLVNRTPVIFTADGLAMPPVALRFRAQLAENGKVWSHAAELPELAHNEVEALDFVSQMLPAPLVIFLGVWRLADRFADPRPGLRSMLESLGVEHMTIDPSAMWPDAREGRAAAVLRTMLLLDSASVYLGILRAIDPYAIPAITELKRHVNPD